MPTTITTATEAAAGDFASFDVPGWVWVALVAVIAALLLIDLLLVHRTPHVISFREAAIESAIWIALGLGFALVVLWWQDGQAAGEYLAGYLIEKSLSVDNVFVWAVVLFWGVFGALVLRAGFIFAGVALIERFDWVLYLFGAFLVYTGVKIARHSGTEVHPEHNPVLKLVRRFLPVSNTYHGQRMVVREAGKWIFTPLFTVLVLVEATDVVFAVDSVPAILAVSREPFIVFASNAFAILGLRSLYFLLAGMAGRFRYLNVGLGVILGFVGVKMLLADVVHLPVTLSLLVIAVVLTVAIWSSITVDRRTAGRGPSTEAPHPDEEHTSADIEVADPETADEDARHPYLDIHQDADGD
jgi:tellurite resistance protein TerC